MNSSIYVLRSPEVNKGVGFTESERDKYNLRGLLPPRVIPLEVLVQGALDNLRKCVTTVNLTGQLNLHDYDETLFYRLLMDNVKEIMPLVYTPIVGLGCQNYSKVYRRTRGLFLSIHDKGKIADIVRQWPQRDVRVIVVTDGERILGLGDLGANGMGIPVGKLMLYTACAGVEPKHCLPVTIDVGTNNKKYLKDPLYIGNQHERVRGAEYDAFVEECLTVLNTQFDGPLIQFEDFGNSNAFRLLHHYQPRICTFNDDIEGTASVALAGIFAAGRITKKNLDQQKFLFSGAGEAGLGIAALICSALKKDYGIADGRDRCWFVDSKGLVVASRFDSLSEHKRPFAHEGPFLKNFIEAVEYLKPTAIIGVSGVPQVFTKEVIELMSSLNERPIVFALSNPTSQAECTAEQAYRHSQGRAVFASGSPFEPVTLSGKTFIPGQGNNAYIFPAVGYAVVQVQALHVREEMFLVAAQALAGLVSEADLANGLVYPPLSSIREVSLHVAAAVAEEAFRLGLARIDRPVNLLEFLRSNMYEPAYAAMQDHSVLRLASKL